MCWADNDSIWKAHRLSSCLKSMPFPVAVSACYLGQIPSTASRRVALHLVEVTNGSTRCKVARFSFCSHLFLSISGTPDTHVTHSLPGFEPSLRRYCFCGLACSSDLISFTAHSHRTILHAQVICCFVC